VPQLHEAGRCQKGKAKTRQVGRRAANTGDKMEQEKNAAAMKRRRSANQSDGEKTEQENDEAEEALG